MSPLYVIVILLLGVLFFGKNLPDVARQVGAALIEFRKGVNEWKDVYHRTPSGGNTNNSPPRQQGNTEVALETFESAGTKFSPPMEDTSGGL